LDLSKIHRVAVEIPEAPMLHPEASAIVLKSTQDALSFRGMQIVQIEHADAIVSVIINDYISDWKRKTTDKTDSDWTNDMDGKGWYKKSSSETRTERGMAVVDLQVKVSDPRTSEILWSYRKRREGKDVVMVVDRVIGEIADHFVRR
jgi:hypothetical protein